MEIKLIISAVVLFFMTTYVYAQGNTYAQIENYSKAYTKATVDKEAVKSKEVKASVVKIDNVKVASSNLKSTEEINALSSPTKHILFKESFSNKTLDNLWLKDSDTKNMMGFDTPSNGKVLKICNKYQSSSMIEYYLDDSVKDKNLTLECKIKTEDIKQGENRFDIGQLAIEYQIEGKFVYPAVQSLVFTKDWETYYAREDGSTQIDDTSMGHYVFTIPRNAKNIRLYLGLQNCTGTIYFKDLVLYEILK